jgi:hypothetical protein
MSTQLVASISAGSVPSNSYKYPVDSITEDTPCLLYEPIEWKRRAIKVIEDIVMVGGTFYTTPIPLECAKCHGL